MCSNSITGGSNCRDPEEMCVADNDFTFNFEQSDDNTVFFNPSGQFISAGFSYCCITLQNVCKFCSSINSQSWLCTKSFRFSCIKAIIILTGSQIYLFLSMMTVYTPIFGTVPLVAPH